MLTINLNGNEYPLACNLRVAYVLQNQHNHESYSSILSRVGEMPLEQQIDVLYAAFQIANPETAKTFTREMFRTYATRRLHAKVYSLPFRLIVTIVSYLQKFCIMLRNVIFS